MKIIRNFSLGVANNFFKNVPLLPLTSKKHKPKERRLINLTTSKLLKNWCILKVERSAADQEMIVALHIFESSYTMNKARQKTKRLGSRQYK